jgi:hypothetical protein
MLGLAQAVNVRPKPFAPTKAFRISMLGLRRLAAWGLIAAGALVLAVLTSRSELGSERITAVLHGGHTQVAAHKFDAEAETHKLAEAVRDLATDGDQIKSRLAAVEHDMDDVTGSISKQVEAADAARRESETGPTAAATAASSVILTPALMRPAIAAAAPKPSADATPQVGSPPTEYAVDIGSGLTIEALRARWLAIYAAHPQLFAGMKPIVSVKEVPRGNRVELRLVVGPIAQSAAATQLCASLTPFGLFCQPTLYDGQRLALR